MMLTEAEVDALPPEKRLDECPLCGFVLTMGRIAYDYSEREEKRSLQSVFQEQVERWKEDTEHYSSLSKMIMHPSYRRIMGMGPAALPFIFRELKERPDHWFIALNAITGIDPVPDKSTFDEAVSAWLDWGNRQGYLQ
ncbi:MAG: hypothetical protein WAO21_02000 [Verrucomicrobiia bacterium]